MTHPDSQDTREGLVERLLPCPFCGSVAALIDFGADGPFYASCGGCGMMTPNASTEAELVAAWNRRPDDRALPAPIKLRDKVIAAAADALDLADGLIDQHLGTDTPKEWGRAFRRVATARAALSAMEARNG